MSDLVKTARRAEGSDLLPKVSFGTMNAEKLLLRMADRIEELEAERQKVREEALREAAEEANEVAQARLSDERDTALACRDRTLALISTNQKENLND